MPTGMFERSEFADGQKMRIRQKIQTTEPIKKRKISHTFLIAKCSIPNISKNSNFTKWSSKSRDLKKSTCWPSA